MYPPPEYSIIYTRLVETNPLKEADMCDSIYGLCWGGELELGAEAWYRVRSKWSYLLVYPLISHDIVSHALLWFWNR